MRRLDRRALFASGAAAALLAASGLSAEGLPRRGGRLRIAAADGEGVAAVARGAVFETLTEVAPDGLLRGELATSWHGSSDAAHWRIELREGAVFHDGRGFTAQDAVATLLAEESPVAKDIAEARPARGGIEIALHAGDPHFPYRLSDPMLSVMPAGARPGAMEGWVGTGLYRVVTARDGRQYLGRRVDAHWKDGQAGWVDTVEVIAITDDAVREEALRDGFVDVAEGAEALEAGDHVGQPRIVSERARLDDGRIAERWWIA
ncbi:MAG: peptide ABC transporter substrate-binding protein [Rhodobacteraceae bacterium]|nr:peptide ABC transporter substrate-binding protein [Paracoccaceae bacterium]